MELKPGTLMMVNNIPMEVADNVAVEIVDEAPRAVEQHGVGAAEVVLGGDCGSPPVRVKQEVDEDMGDVPLDPAPNENEVGVEARPGTVLDDAVQVLSEHNYSPFVGAIRKEEVISDVEDADGDTGVPDENLSDPSHAYNYEDENQSDGGSAEEDISPVDIDFFPGNVNVTLIKQELEGEDEEIDVEMDDDVPVLPHPAPPPPASPATSNISTAVDPPASPAVRECLICGLKLVGLVAFRDHMLTKHMHRQPYTCMLCWKSFFTAREIIRHTDSNCKQVFYKCQRCNRVWSSDTADAACQVCSQEQVDKSAWTPYECAACGEAFTLLRHLTAHVKTHARLELRRPYKCRCCSKTYETSVMLMIHAKQHSPSKAAAPAPGPRSKKSVIKVKRLELAADQPTAAQLAKDLDQPYVGLRQAPADVSQTSTANGHPSIDNGRTSTDNGQPCTDNGQLSANFGQPPTDTGLPSTGLGEPFNDFGQLSADFGQPFSANFDQLTAAYNHPPADYGQLPDDYGQPADGPLRDEPLHYSIPIIKMEPHLGHEEDFDDHFEDAEEFDSHEEMDLAEDCDDPSWVVNSSRKASQGASRPKPKSKAGPKSRSRSAGPRPAAPRPAGPRPLGPSPLGPSPLGPSPGGPSPAGIRTTSGIRTSGPHPAKPRPAGPRPSGHRPAESRSEGPRPAGPRPAGAAPRPKPGPRSKSQPGSQQKSTPAAVPAAVAGLSSFPSYSPELWNQDYLHMQSLLEPPTPLQSALETSEQGPLEDPAAPRPRAYQHRRANAPKGFSDAATWDGWKRFRCQWCPKVFRFSHQMNVHMRTHTGERPYRCRMCEQAFRQSNHLRRHLKDSHQLVGEEIKEHYTSMLALKRKRMQRERFKALTAHFAKQTGIKGFNTQKAMEMLMSMVKNKNMYNDKDMEQGNRAAVRSSKGSSNKPSSQPRKASNRRSTTTTAAAAGSGARPEPGTSSDSGVGAATQTVAGAGKPLPVMKISPKKTALGSEGYV